jgi:hypothetical protein
MLYKIEIYDRNYENYTILPVEDDIETDKDKVIHDIYEKRLFHKDIFTLDTSGNITLYSSPTRDNPICGVLILSGNKTYGRDIKVNGKPGRLFYRFIPNNSHLPIFLVPYQAKHIGFSKLQNNIYAKIQYEEWNTKHPQGKLIEVFGDVSKPENYYEYQLHCKDLLSNHLLWKQMNTYLTNSNYDKLIENICEDYNIQDSRTSPEWYIFTIDPAGSQDLDDALSIKYLENEIIQISIYISNVTLIINKLNLWNYIEERVSTIYLPHRIIPMLPTILSNNICSLKENKLSLAFCLDIFIRNNEIIHMNWLNCQITVSKNYSYDTSELHENKYYKSLIKVTETLNKKAKYMEQIKDSHDVVSYWMIYMNHQSGRYLIDKNSGIFRKTTNAMHENAILGEYSLLSADLMHSGLGLNGYIHITSPIRRVIDILNMYIFQTFLHIEGLKEECASSMKKDIVNPGMEFYNKCCNKLDKINKEMRLIRKLQNESSLLDKFYKYPKLLEEEYDCILLSDEIIDNYTKRQEIYIPQLKIYKTIKIYRERKNVLLDNPSIYKKSHDNNCEDSMQKCRLYLFRNEHNFREKIKVEILLRYI